MFMIFGNDRLYIGKSNLERFQVLCSMFVLISNGVSKCCGRGAHETCSKV